MGLLAALLLSSLATLAWSHWAQEPQEGGVYVDAERGFEIRVPTGWDTAPEPQADGSHTIWFFPPQANGRVLLGVNVQALEEGQGVEFLLSNSLAVIGADPAFGEPERFDAELDGGMRPALRMPYASDAGPLTLEVGHCVAHGRGYVVQRAAPPEEFSDWHEEFGAMLASFRTRLPVELDATETLLRKLAARCGSQVYLAPTWAEAAQSARALGRPILVIAWAYPGFELPVRPESSLLSDPDLVELIATRFVAWKLDPSEQNDFASAYGLSPSTFGQALIVATDTGETLAELDDASSAHTAYAFLRKVLAEHTPTPPAAANPELDVAQGELERALANLSDAQSPNVALLRARALRLLQRGTEALTELQPVTMDAAFAADALAERTRIELSLGRAEGARASATALVAEYGQSPRAAEAQMILGLLDARAGAPELARQHWLALCAAHPESPWAWQAADALVSGLLDSGLLEGADYSWPSAAQLAESLDLRPWDPLPIEAAAAARDRALAWLLEHQRADGSWTGAVDSGAAHGAMPNPFVDSVTALAARALIEHRGKEPVDSALKRAYAFLLASVESRAEAPGELGYMDYTPWSDVAMLDAFAAALDAKLCDADALRAAAANLIGDLETRRQPHGGWGYYVTGDLDGAAAPPSSMSFTTAAVVLSLARARAAGINFEPAALKDASAALESMRTAEGHFVYMQGPGAKPEVPQQKIPEAAGRAPVCELALLRARRSTPARLSRALEVFLADAPLLAAERGKALMHCGAQGQGCHYILFDYAWAAAAAAEVRSDRETRLRLTHLVLDCRRDDGSFLDTPINGAAYGTAQALLALDALLP